MRNLQPVEEIDLASLPAALGEAEARLADVIEERQFTLSQTGVHIGAKEAATMRRAWERDEERLRQRIVEINKRLGK